jgi:hypothetical protein
VTYIARFVLEIAGGHQSKPSSPRSSGSRIACGIVRWGWVIVVDHTDLVGFRYAVMEIVISSKFVHGEEIWIDHA